MTCEPLKHRLYRGLSKLSKAASPASHGPGLRALMYHSVGTALSCDPYGTGIDAVLFRAQMEDLAAGPRPVVALDRGPLDRDGIAITFDDGYKDTLTTAAPILAALRLPLTLFVATANLRDSSGLYLDSSGLKTLAAQPGVTIGAHGHTHTPLTALSDSALREELAVSRKILEDLVGRRVDCLSYPHGLVDRRVRDAARKAGFVLGACSRYGLNGPGRDPLLLCRTEITAWDDAEAFALKLDGHWDWFRWRHADPQKC